MKQFARKSVTLENGETMAYIEAGHGDKVMIGCHGNYSSCLGMYYLIENFEQDYRVIIPDARGFGDSTWNTPITSMEDFAHDYILFAKALGINKAIVVGHSFGGATAMEIAIQAPELVEKLVLIAPTSVGGYPLFKKLPVGKLLPFQNIEEMVNYPINKPTFAMIESKNLEAGKKFIALISPCRAGDEEALNFLATEMLKERCLPEACWALCTWNISNKPSMYARGNGNVKLIKCPVFLATAGKDTFITPIMNKLNAAALAINGHLTHKFYPFTGHAIYEDAPVIFFNDVKAFLK